MGGDSIRNTVFETLAKTSSEAAGKEEKVETAPPRKRAVVLTCYVLCLSFLVFFVNILFEFISTTINNEKVWKNIGVFFNQTMKNHCATSNK